MATKAHELAEKQREIGVAEFFSRNRHLLGFDNKRKALMTTIKEAVDNSLDACDEIQINPEIIVEVIDMGNDRFKVIVEDNGPGIVKEQIPNIFAKLLYGSKFHSFKMSRGQQGIGISASVMYGQLTTGKAAKITSRIGAEYPAHYFELKIDSKSNQPIIESENETEWEKDHGTRIEIDLEASYQKGGQSVDEYLKQTAITNPHATFIYTNPKAEQVIFPKGTDDVPQKAVEIKPHPYGVEIGLLIEMIQRTDSRTLQAFLTKEFSRVGAETAKQICENGRLLPNAKPAEMSREKVEQLMKGIKNTKLMNPSSDGVISIGSDELEKGLRKEINAEFFATITRPTSVYRGNPFIVEVGVAYGGKQPGDQSINLIRFANRVPLLYQQGACAVTKGIIGINWRPYGLNQSQGAIPVGPCTVLVHIASVWVPFTSESKEAIAHYPEIVKEVKLALQDVGRKLGSYINKKKRVSEQQKRINIFENYIPEVADALARISGKNKEAIINALRSQLEKNKEFVAMNKAETNDEFVPEYGLARSGDDNEEEI